MAFSNCRLYQEGGYGNQAHFVGNVSKQVDELFISVWNYQQILLRSFPLCLVQKKKKSLTHERGRPSTSPFTVVLTSCKDMLSQ